MKSTIEMTHQEIENLIARESAVRRRESLQHLASLGEADTAPLARWSRHATVRRYLAGALVVVVSGVGVGTVTAQTLPYRAVAEDSTGRYCYTVSQGDPLEAYDTLRTTLLKQ